MRLIFLTALLFASASPLAAQTRSPPPAVTRDQAMTLSPDELAEIVLRQLGAQMTSVERPNFGASSDMRMVSALQHLTLATAPRATDRAGLCVANLIQLDFDRPPERLGIDNNRADTPVSVREMRAMPVYKVIGAIAPAGEMSEARREEENRRCAAAGPVIYPNYSDREGARFFDYDGGIALATALLALRRAIDEARAGRYRDIAISCESEAAACRDPAALLGSLDLSALGNVQVAPAGVSGERDLYRIYASFLINVDAHNQEYWVFSMEAEISELMGPGNSDPIRRLGPSQFTRTLTIDN
jgi:hypothetical protein